MPNGGSIVMGAHWNTQNTSKYTCILMYFAYSNGLPSQYCHHYCPLTNEMGGKTHLEREREEREKLRFFGALSCVLGTIICSTANMGASAKDPPLKLTSMLIGISLIKILVFYKIFF